MSSQPDLTDRAVVDRAARLRGLCGGAVLFPGDSRYDEARRPWNATIDQRPAAVAYPANADEVSDVVRAAVSVGLRVAPQSTGHNAGPLTALHDVVLLRTSAMTKIDIDRHARTARVDAGAVWSDVVDDAGQHGLAGLHGASASVGVVGHCLGGGIGWYSRSLGLACNSIVALDVVAADGEQLRADRHTNADLFWALRGGGGSFGIVTAMEFRFYPIESVYAGTLTWDQSRVESVLRTWAAWTRDCPTSATTSLRLVSPTPAGERSVQPDAGAVVMTGAILGTDEDAAKTLRPLRALAPIRDSFARVPASSLTGLQTDPRGPHAAFASSATLTDLPDDAVASFLASVDSVVGMGAVSAEIRQLGGALAEPAQDAGALSRIDGRYLLRVTASPRAGRTLGYDPTRDVVRAPAGTTSAPPVLNFVEHPVDVSTAFDRPTWSRLQSIRSSVDPEGAIVANHPVGPRGTSDPTDAEDSSLGSPSTAHREAIR